MTWLIYKCCDVSRLMTKTTKWHVRPLKTQISPGILPVWSESSLFTSRKLGSLATPIECIAKTDQTGQMPRLMCVFARHSVILLVLSWGGSCRCLVLFQLCLEVLDAVICYSYLPSECLQHFVASLCNLVNIPKFCEGSWEVWWFVCCCPCCNMTRYWCPNCLFVCLSVHRFVHPSIFTLVISLASTLAFKFISHKQRYRVHIWNTYSLETDRNLLELVFVVVFFFLI